MDPAAVGRTYAGGPYEVGRDAVRTFAAAVGEHDPRCHDVGAARAAGHADLVAPPTFAFALTMRVGERILHDPGLGLVYQRAVHGEQSFQYRRPILAGDAVTVVGTIAGVAVQGRNEVLTTEYLLSGADGAEILRTREVIITRGTAG
jgi:acyl dehydratase